MSLPSSHAASIRVVSGVTSAAPTCKRSRWNRIASTAKLSPRRADAAVLREEHFRRLNAPEQCRNVFLGVRYVDGIKVPVNAPAQMAAT